MMVNSQARTSPSLRLACGLSKTRTSQSQTRLLAALRLRGSVTAERRTTRIRPSVGTSTSAPVTPNGAAACG